MFEKVNSAYEFLCSKSRLKEGPDPQNIVLILKTQSILFGRHKEGNTTYTETCLIQTSDLLIRGSTRYLYSLTMVIDTS
jgi:hypothetical protein